MDDLISEFITETAESLSVLDSELVKLEQNPGDATILSNIFRLVHTIKGTCGFLGLPRLESVAHASENVLGKIRDKVFDATPAAISLVLESLDCIKTIMDYLGSNGQEPAGDDSDLIRRLNHFAETGGLAEAGEGASPAPAVEPPPVAQEEAAAAVPDEFGAVPPLSPTPPEVSQAVAPAPEPAKVAAPEKPAAPMPVAPKEAPAADAKGGEGGGGPANQSIRVNLDVLESLMQMVGELVLTRNQLMQIARTRNDNTFMGPLQHLSYITSELQEGVMKTRMQPIGNAWAKFPRLIRDLSHELGKKIELRMLGAETELDRQLLELIKDPLTHMVRNSCDHGLETVADRQAAGKPETGTVTLSAYHEGGHIIVEISDDGRGLNISKIKEKAVANGVTTASELEHLTDQQIMQFIFRAGFSTAEKVTSVSGRGVGMDVVRTNIEKIGGTIELSSALGKGSKFHIKIPLTLAIVSVLIVEAGAERFAMPQINVVELVRGASGSEYVIETINRSPVLRLRDQLLPLISLSEVLKLSGGWENQGQETFIVVCKVGGQQFGLIVDKIYDTEEIVVKPVASVLKDIPIYSGNTILGDGSVIMILDPNGLAKSAGELEMKGKDEGAGARSLTGERLINFLLFKAGRGAPKAVPLELVSRLEEIDTATIEWSGDHPVVQYRGDLMRLMALDDSYTIPQEGIVEVIVFTYDNKVLGLVVNEISDIVEAPLGVKMASSKPGFLGSMVILGKTTDVIDVGYFLADVVGNVADTTVVEQDSSAVNYQLLLVEDSPFFRNLTTPFLAAVGYQVTAVDSASEALRLMNSQKFDLIVSDIEMPDINGFEFADLCRTSGKFTHIPMIAFTSTINQQLIQRGAEAGFRDFIVKTDREGLIKAIAKHLAQEREAA